MNVVEAVKMLHDLPFFKEKIIKAKEIKRKALAREVLESMPDYHRLINRAKDIAIPVQNNSCPNKLEGHNSCQEIVIEVEGEEVAGCFQNATPLEFWYLSVKNR